MNVLDLFSGIGGFSLGLERAGMKTVAFCEQDKFCQSVLQKNLGGGATMRGYRKTLEAITKGIDVISAGFPCQDESLSGSRKGVQFNESSEVAITRSGLFWPLMQTIRLVRPLYAVLENVAGLLSGSMGIVVGKLAESGYDCEWDSIPTGIKYGHLRERVFVVAHADSDGLQGGELELTSDKGRGPFRASLLPTFKVRHNRPENVLSAPYIIGKDDGIPDRAHRTKSLGNAVTPDALEVIGREIMKAVGPLPSAW